VREKKLSQGGEGKEPSRNTWGSGLEGGVLKNTEKSLGRVKKIKREVQDFSGDKVEKRKKSGIERPGVKGIPGGQSKKSKC